MPNQFFLAFTIAIFGMAFTTIGQSQVLNPGFEWGSGNSASNWTMFGNSYRDQTRPHSGTFCMKLYGNFTGGPNVTGAYQDMRISPGERVAASTWAVTKASDAMAGDNYAILKIIYRDSSNRDLVSTESRRITSSTTRDQFQLVTASLGTAPAGTHHCSVFLLFVQPASTPFASGSTLFDDVGVTVTAAKPLELVWSDEFEGSALNTSNWEPQIGDGTAYGLPAGWGNNELQYYSARPENLGVSGGMLRIVARKENYMGRTYTSARLRTKGKRDFLYGRIEARMKVPAGKGLWSAFWMMPTASRYGGWASSGEIDIVETLNMATAAYGTIHFGGQYPANAQSGGSKAIPPGFHVYAVEWEPDAIRWYVDGQLYFSRSSLDWYSLAAPGNERAPFDDPFHLLLNLAVGGDWPGYPDATTPPISELLVDWVRVYRFPTRITSVIEASHQSKEFAEHPVIRSVRRR